LRKIVPVEINVKFIDASIFNSVKYYLSILLLLLIPTLHAQTTDIRLLRDFNLGRNRSLDPTFLFVTHTVAPLNIIVPVGVGVHYLVQRDSITKNRVLLIGGTLVTAAILTTSLKYAVNRPRPFRTYTDIDPRVHVGRYSFPSGHTSAAFALATSITMAYPKWYVGVPAFVWAAAAGYSRLHLGVHYPSDVLAGALIGSGSAWLNWKLNSWLLRKWSR
jgi:membrane-associated phospholipid phosphatase